MNSRILAHEIVVDGKSYKLHVATTDLQGNIILQPFGHETPETIFIDGKIEVWYDKACRQMQWCKLESDT